MKSFISFLVVMSLVVLSCITIYSQNLSVIEGNVLDVKTNQPLPNVNVIVSNNTYSTTTDKSGKFSIKNIPQGEYRVKFSCVGYRSKQLVLIVKKNEARAIQVELEQTPVYLGNILVTSTRSQKIIKDIPLPIGVLDKKEILKSASITPSDLLANIPGVSLERDGIWATTVNIRGLSRSDFIILIDGDRIETASDISAALSLIDLNDVDRIEVIKGGSSSLYGSGALGGIVNFITRDPQYVEGINIKGNLNSSYNSVNSGNSQNISMSLFSRSWNLNLSGSLRNAANTKTPVGTLQNSQYHDNNFSSFLSVKPADNQRLNIKYQRYYGHDIGIPGGYPLFPDNAQVKYTKVERDLFSAGYSMTNINAYFTKFSLEYYNQNIYRFVENIPYQIQNPNPLTQINVEKITPNARHYLNGIKLETNWVIGQSNYLIAGLDIWQRDLDSRREKYLQITSFDSTGNITNVQNQMIGEKPLPEASYRSSGIFLQDDVILLPKKLTLTIGGRIDKINIKNNLVYNPVYIITNDSARSENYNPPNQTLYWEASSEQDISWSGSISALYSLVNDVDISFNIARSFRSPSLEERFQYIDLGNLLRIGNPNLKPEKGLFVDLGLRIWKEKFSFQGSTFMNKLNDLVTEINGIFESRPAKINENIGKSLLYGYDFRFDYNFYENYILYGSGAYVRGEDIENYSDLPAIPPLNGKLGIKSMMFNLFDIDFSATFFADQNKIAPGEISTPGYTYYDLYLSSIPIKVEAVDLNIFAGIENLTNKAYRNHLSTNRGLITIEPGRNFYLKLNLSW
jgi:outer membrane receptor protein involved in Fe transport